MLKSRQHTAKELLNGCLFHDKPPLNALYSTNYASCNLAEVAFGSECHSNASDFNDFDETGVGLELDSVSNDLKVRVMEQDPQLW